MTYRLSLVACAALACLQPHDAAAVTVTGSGTWSAFPGHGYDYTATWQASAGEFAFTPLITSSSSGRYLYFSGSLVALTPTLDVPTFDLSFTLQVRIFNIATGALEMPAELAGMRSDHSTASLYGATGFDGSGFRFSNPLFQNTTAIVNSTTGLPVPPRSDPALSTAVTFRLEEHYVRGNFLLPSNDPTCASLDCMTPGHDILQIGNAGRFVYQIGNVPEPSTWLLWLSGAGLLVGARGVHRRRAPACDSVAIATFAA